MSFYLLQLLASIGFTYIGNFWYINSYFIDFFHVVKGEQTSSHAWQFHWNSQIWKSTHFFNPVTFAPQSHEAKIAFRFTIPFLLKIFHQNILFVYFSQIALGLFAYRKFIEIIFNVSKDKKITFLFATGVSSLYFISSFHLELLALGDSFAYSFLILGYHYLSKRFWSISFLLAALLTDERSIIGCVMGLFFIYFEHNSLLIKHLISTIFAFLIYLFIRLFLFHQFGLSTPSAGIGFSILFENSSHLLLFLFNAFKSFYVIYFFPFLFCKKRIEVIYGIFLLMVMASSLLVWDITRSMSYSFWGLLIGLQFMVKYVRNKEMIIGILIGIMVSSLHSVTVIFP